MVEYVVTPFKTKRLPEDSSDISNGKNNDTTKYPTCQKLWMGFPNMHFMAIERGKLFASLTTTYVHKLVPQLKFIIKEAREFENTNPVISHVIQ